MRPITEIIIHHTASPRDVTLDQIDRWHRERGFNKIGYHFLIDGKGVVHEGRPLQEIGAHCRGHNLVSAGVAVTGDNTREGLGWIGAQWLGLILLVEKLQARFGPIPVLGHRDTGAATECPGLDVRAILLAENPLRAAGVVAGGD